MEIPPLKDLGLTYMEASHGVQSAIVHAMREPEYYSAAEPKHLRVGVDLRASDAAGLARLLIDKGLFTLDEYCEYMRLAANQELHDWQLQTGLTYR